MSMKLDKEKQQLIGKFDNLMRQNKDITPETIKEIFPDDEELYEKVKELKEKEKETLSKYIFNDDNQQNEEKDNNDNENKKSPRKNEKNIEKKIEVDK